MFQINGDEMNENIKNGFIKAGEFVLDSLDDARQNTVDKIRSEGEEKEYTNGLARFVKALVEIKTKDDEIERLLQKYWDYPAEEATKILSYYRIEYHKEEFMRYLRRNGYTTQGVREYCMSHSVFLEISHNPELHKKTPEQLKAYFDKKK